MARGKNKRNTYRRRGRLRLLYLLLSILLIVAAIVTSAVYFFRVEHIEMSGNTRYSNEQILTVAGIDPNANLFLLPRKTIATQLKNSLPYVKSLQFKSVFPSTLQIQIVECVPLAALRSDGGVWLIDAEGKVLEQVDDAMAADLIQVEGLTPIAPQVGTRVQVVAEDGKKLEAFCALLTGLEQHGMARDTRWINMSGDTDIEMGYLGRFDVRLPLRMESSAIETGGGMYSLKAEALSKITSLLDETDRGIIDLWEDKGFFRPR